MNTTQMQTYLTVSVNETTDECDGELNQASFSLKTDTSNDHIEITMFKLTVAGGDVKFTGTIQGNGDFNVSANFNNESSNCSFISSMTLQGNFDGNFASGTFEAVNDVDDNDPDCLGKPDPCTVAGTFSE